MEGVLTLTINAMTMTTTIISMSVTPRWLVPCLMARFRKTN
jgi:hypothetical protein